MTKDRSATPWSPDIPAVHAAIAPVRTLVRDRRRLYQVAAELVCPGAASRLEYDVTDSPIARHRIGNALAGGQSPDGAALVKLDDVVGERGRVDTGVSELAVASRSDADRVLAEALDAVGAELDRQQAASGRLRLVTEAAGERFDRTLEVLRAGVALAQSTSRELIDDLLPHITLVGIIDPQHAGRLGSASPRRHPGLVLLESPQSSIDAAEALVHEGAHQKLFDLAITHDLLADRSEECPPFHPPWMPADRRWPLEQTLAAGHAYACLARLARDLNLSTSDQVIAASSLLPVASERCEKVIEWLLEMGGHLGTDAHTLLGGLSGIELHPADLRVEHPFRVDSGYTVAPGLQLHRCEDVDRVLVGCPTQPPELFWVNADAARTLELLAYKPFGDVVAALADQWGVGPPAAADRLAPLLRKLYSSGLVRRPVDGCRLPTERR